MLSGRVVPTGLPKWYPFWLQPTRCITNFSVPPASGVPTSSDEDLAAETRNKGYPCGGRLRCANYPRKPKSTPAQLPERQRIRLSFCCDRDGCRKRATPPSVHFLGRKVYLTAIVILISAMRQGPSPRRIRELFHTLQCRRKHDHPLADLLAQTLPTKTLLDDHTRQFPNRW